MFLHQGDAASGLHFLDTLVQIVEKALEKRVTGSVMDSINQGSCRTACSRRSTSFFGKPLLV
jgi:hypothetical protein